MTMKAYGFCKTCKKCCVSKTTPSKMWVSENELELIKKESGMDVQAEQEKDTGLFIITSQGSRCQFLGEKGCILKKNKPITCVMYPFRLVGSEWVLRLQCPSWHKIRKEDFEAMLRHFKKHKEDWGVQK